MSLTVHTVVLKSIGNSWTLNFPSGPNLFKFMHNFLYMKIFRFYGFCKYIWILDLLRVGQYWHWPCANGSNSDPKWLLWIKIDSIVVRSSSTMQNSYVLFYKKSPLKDFIGNTLLGTPHSFWMTLGTNFVPNFYAIWERDFRAWAGCCMQRCAAWSHHNGVNFYSK